MTDIKTTLMYLCKHLNATYDVKMKPEMFRLAKFNKSDDNVVHAFWTLLHRMINLAASEEVILDVKYYFLSNLNYKNLHFYSLPHNMSSGSRELLLAFAYILSKDYLNKYIKVLIDNSPFNANYQLRMVHDSYNIKDYTFNLKHLKTDEDFENAFQWIEGRIKLNNKTYLEYKDSFEKLSAEIYKKNSISQQESLSILAILALSSTKHGTKFLQETEVLSKILEYYNQWLKTQSIFWEWMNSVLVEKRKQAELVNIEEIEKFTDMLQ